MSDVQQGERMILTVGATAPTLEVQFTDESETVPRDITGYSVEFSFWKVGDGASVQVYQGYLFDAANGKARYELNGQEFGSAGYYIWQATARNPGKADYNSAEAQEWGSVTSQPFKVTVLGAAP